MHMYYLLISGPLDESKWQILQDRGILTAEEVLLLQQHGSPPVVLYSWVIQIIVSVSGLPVYFHSNMEKCMDGIREAKKQITYTRTQTPFVYVNVVCLFNSIFLAVMSYRASIDMIVSTQLPCPTDDRVVASGDGAFNPADSAGFFYNKGEGSKNFTDFTHMNTFTPEQELTWLRSRNQQLKQVISAQTQAPAPPAQPPSRADDDAMQQMTSSPRLRLRRMSNAAAAKTKFGTETQSQDLSFHEWCWWKIGGRFFSQCSLIFVFNGLITVAMELLDCYGDRRSCYDLGVDLDNLWRDSQNILASMRDDLCKPPILEARLTQAAALEHRPTMSVLSSRKSSKRGERCAS